MSMQPAGGLGRVKLMTRLFLCVLVVQGAALSAGLPAPARADDGLRLGIYPWGAAGATTQIARSVPENAQRSMDAVQRLRGDRPFVVHLYGDYTGESNASVNGLLSEAKWWSDSGLKVSAVLRYRPADASKAAGYPAWVRTQARRLAALSQTVAVHIANEPNNLRPGVGDGSYPGVIAAIAAAVPAARSELDSVGRQDVKVGFNWAAGALPETTEPMWEMLRSAGGEAFARAVDFVGVNVYPGTWSPPLVAMSPTSTQVASTVRGALDALRSKHMPAAGVGSADIVVAETGYPTTATRSEATQNLVLRTIIETVRTERRTYGVTDLYAFALRDGNTSSGELENGYGLLRDDYSAKPAFDTVRRFVAEGAAAPLAPGVVRDSAKLQVARARIDVRRRQLDLLMPITGRATGTVLVSIRAAGRTTRFTAPIDSDRGHIQLRRRIPASQARMGTALIEVTYSGNQRTRPQNVRLRAASGRARLRVTELELSQRGRLTARGTISRRVRGVVRLQLEYEHDGRVRRVQTYARISNGRWTIDRQLSRKQQEQIAQRTGSLHSYTLFTGHLPSGTRGEMRSYQLRPG